MNEYITGASKVAGTSLAVEDGANQCLITKFEEACGDGCSSDLQDAVVCHLGDSALADK